MAIGWTKQQLEAMDATGSDLLVSAAAGSGKTAVLVERIIRKVTAAENPLDIDRLLVVTFTKAAAAEMSQRIGAAISKKLEEEPQNTHLQNQLAYLSHADIKTIHAFCLQVIREYYDLLDIDPAAKTADPSEILLLQKEVLADLFEEWYEAAYPPFLRLLETYGEDTGDSRLKDLVLQIYEFAQGYPQPETLLWQMAERFQMQEEDGVDQCPWIALIQESISHQTEYVLYQLEKAARRIAADSDFTAYQERLTEEMEQIQALREALQTIGYARWHTAYAAVTFGRMPAYRGENKETAEWVKQLRNDAKAAWAKLGETYFCYGADMQSACIRALYPTSQALSALVTAFMTRFAAAKKEKLWLDFHDYEHFALRVLTKPESTADCVLPTEAALQMQKKYEEIMIDEYQDSNLVQEMLLRAVSRECRETPNRFMVGDVKQSIYRFRLAMPQLFQEKYRSYPLQPGGKTRKILLSENFRSRKTVLDGINFLFRQIMSMECGEVSYDEEAALHAGAAFPPAEGLCGGENEVILLDMADAEEMELPEALEELNKRQMEAILIAEKIHSLMAAGYQVLDKASNTYRPLEYRDIAILLRSIRNWGSTLDDIFGKEGIPYYAETAEGYFDVPEVDTVLNMLRLTDNPYQDIPLLSLLHAPLYRLSADALAQIRLFGGDGLFYECVLRYLEAGEDTDIRDTLRAFQEDLLIWREKAREISLTELLRYLYTDTGYYDYVGMTTGGALRQANLRLLLEKAETYEKNSGRGLFHFIQFVADMKTAEEESAAAKLQSESENLVRVMTIHKSKGLEFPVVFVADMGKQFNEMDTRAAVITHAKWGYGLDYTDLEQRVTYRTLAKTALAEAIRQENLSEEMRVLYVALTRAKEKLILTGTVKNLQKSIEKWADTADCPDERLPVFRLRRGRNYLDWVMPALLRHPQCQQLPEIWEPTERGEPYIFWQEPSAWRLTLMQKGELYQQETQKRQISEAQKAVFDQWDVEKDYSGARAEVFRILSWQYPNAFATALPAKVSISEIKRRYMEEITGEDQTVQTEWEIPAFGQKQTTLTAAQIGTAMHTFLEAADLRKKYESADVEQLLTALTESGRLTAEEAAAVHRKELLAFFSSELAERIRKADMIRKEQPFSMLMEPKEVFFDETYRDVEEYVQVNGIIDCYFQEGEDMVLVDYKSDRIRSEEAFRERYDIQLRLYREALERVTGRKVKACYLYSFALGRALEM
mgnify:CR=1 FL=1